MTQALNALVGWLFAIPMIVFPVALVYMAAMALYFGVVGL